MGHYSLSGMLINNFSVTPQEFSLLFSNGEGFFLEFLYWFFWKIAFTLLRILIFIDYLKNYFVKSALPFSYWWRILGIHFSHWEITLLRLLQEQHLLVSKCSKLHSSLLLSFHVLHTSVGLIFLWNEKLPIFFWFNQVETNLLKPQGWNIFPR